MRVRDRASAVWLVALAALALGATSCGKKKGSPEETTGAAKIALTGSALGSDVAKVVVTITKGEGPDFPAIVGNLNRRGNDWAGFVSGIPAGKGRKFEVVAYDANQKAILSGSAKADVVSGGVATVVIFLSTPGTGNGNRAPLIEYLSASATLVKPLAKVALSVRARDPDPGQVVTLNWGATCGAFDAPTAADVVWTAPDGAGFCQLSVTATDPLQVSVTAYLVIEINTVTGDVQVIAKFNASPVVSGIRGEIRYRNGGYDGDLSVDATDPDGDALAYAWTTSCADLVVDTRAPYGPTRPHIERPSAQGSCTVTVTVTDPPERGGRTVATLVIGPEPVRSVNPVITVTIQPFVDLADPLRPSLVVPGSTVILGAYALDPEGGPITFAWRASAGTLSGQLDQADRSVVQYGVPNPLPPGTKVTLRVTDVQGTFTERDFWFKPDPSADPCAGQPNGTACSDGNACTRADSCQGGVCTGADPVTCAAAAPCKLPGVCQPSGPSAGTCTYADAPNGTSCSDGVACTGGDACAVGACVPGPSTCGPNATCNTSTGTCVCVPACTGRVCGSDGCGGTCGTCPGSATCNASGQCVAACVPACTGRVCGSDGCGGTCGTCPGTATCNASGQCVAACVPACTGKACGPDGCGGTCGTCTGTTSCSAGGQCVAAATRVAPFAARDLVLAPPGSVCVDRNGDSFLAGNLTRNVDVDFQTRPPPAPPILLRSSGGVDVFLGRYDATGNVTWATTVGVDDPLAEPGGIDQSVISVAVSQNGTLALAGRSSGTVTFGASTISTASPTPYVAAMASTVIAPATAPDRRWIKRYGLGANGQFRQVAANPNQASNRIAVCGFATAAATQLIPGVTYEGGTDLILAVFDTSGTLLWARQLGGPGVSPTPPLSNETCNAVTVDDSGDVVATGVFDGESLTFPGAGPSPTPATLTGPGTAAQKYVWVTRFAGATGNPIQARAFVATSTANPTSVTVRPDGKILLAGNYAGSLTVGRTLDSQGSDDAFVALLEPATLAAIWDASFGGSGLDRLNGVAATSTGDAIVVGTFTGSMGGAGVNLTSNGIAASDIFVVKFDGATGLANDQAVYGDPVTQNGDALAVNRFGLDQVTLATTVVGSATFGSAGTVAVQGVQDVVLVFARLQ